MSIFLLLSSWCGGGVQVNSEALGEFCDPILQRLETAGVRVKYDDRINYTAGWK